MTTDLWVLVFFLSISGETIIRIELIFAIVIGSTSVPEMHTSVPENQCVI